VEKRKRNKEKELSMGTVKLKKNGGRKVTERP
jgi:hypothetical protein